MLKRIVAITLVCLIVVAFVGCSSNTATSTTTAQPSQSTTTKNQYDEKVNFQASYVEYGTVNGKDEIFEYFAKKFNIDIDMIPMPQSGYTEKDRISINGGTMPDWITMWGFNYDEYLSYVDQGLIKALPDGWETKWPTLASAVKASDISDYLTIDGKTYALPHVIFFNFTEYEKNRSHDSVYYRKDWLDTLGIQKYGDVITKSQLYEYCEKAIKADLAGSGKTLGLTGSSGSVIGYMMNMYNNKYNTFWKENSSYVWGPSMPGTIEGISYLRSLYNDGILDPDFYLNKASDGYNKFSSGLAAALIGPGTTADTTLRYNEFRAAGTGDPSECIEMAVLVDDDGKWKGTEQTNYAWATIFSPNLDDAKFERALDLIDYAYTKEAQEIIAMGIPDVDWRVSSDGGYEILSQKDEKGNYLDPKQKYSTIYFWWVQGVLQDDFSLANPTLDKNIVERANRLYDIRAKSTDYRPIDYNCSFLNSPAKSVYSVDIGKEISRIVVDKQIADINTEWQKFIDTNKGMWEPVINDLNNLYND